MPRFNSTVFCTQWYFVILHEEDQRTKHKHDVLILDTKYRSFDLIFNGSFAKARLEKGVREPRIPFVDFEGLWRVIFIEKIVFSYQFSRRIVHSSLLLIFYNHKSQQIFPTKSPAITLTGNLLTVPGPVFNAPQVAHKVKLGEESVRQSLFSSFLMREDWKVQPETAHLSFFETWCLVRPATRIMP